MIVVVDASAVGAFLLADEGGAAANHALAVCQREEVHVPAIWSVEISSLIVNAWKRKRIDAEEREEAVVIADLLRTSVIIEPDYPTAAIVACSLATGLSAYDASYALLCQRLDAPLLTGDGPLRRAADKMGIRLLTA